MIAATPPSRTLVGLSLGSLRAGCWVRPCPPPPGGALLMTVLCQSGLEFLRHVDSRPSARPQQGRKQTPVRAPGRVPGPWPK